MEFARAVQTCSHTMRKWHHKLEHPRTERLDEIMRFQSRGVEASLLTADLDASLSKTIKLQMGKEQARDDQRVDEVLAAGTPLIARPITADGSDHKVLQYVGEHEDIAFMMFEVSEEKSDYVSLTPRKPQALRLAVATNESTHEGTKGLKIEVYLNGALSDCHLFSSSKQRMVTTYTADGTRIHRQVEKPWTYQPSTALPPSKLSAEERWSSASASLKEEVRLRGVNEWGDHQPSAEFLAALADISLPTCLKDKAHMGIVDVIIVAGSGVKDVGSAGYIARPTRLRSEKYSIDNVLHGRQTSPQHESSPGHKPTLGFANGDVLTVMDSRSSSPLPRRAPAEEEDPFADRQGATPAKPPLSYAAPEPPSTSSDVPLAVIQPSKPKLKLNAPKARPSKLTATEQAAKDFAEKNGIAWRQDAMVDNFQDRRGTEKGSRSLTRRITDLQKMTPKNRAAMVEKLQQDFPLEHSTPPRPSKPFKLKMKGYNSNLSAAPTPATAAFQPQPQPKVGSEQDSRTSLAVDYGAAPRGSLVKRIASYSAPRVDGRADTPTLGSSSSVARTPQRDGVTTPVARSSSARKTSHKPGKLDDQTTEEALAAFQHPEECYGSVISYAKGNAQRQIPKTRPGVFEEDEVIVAMRFVLV